MALTVENIIDEMGKDKVKLFAYDSFRSNEEVVSLCLERSVRWAKRKADKFCKIYDDSDLSTRDAVILYCIGEIYDFSNSDAKGIDEKKQAKEILADLWDTDSENTGVEFSPPVISVKQYSGRNTGEAPSSNTSGAPVIQVLGIPSELPNELP